MNNNFKHILNLRKTNREDLFSFSCNHVVSNGDSFNPMSEMGQNHKFM